MYIIEKLKDQIDTFKLLRRNIQLLGIDYFTMRFRYSRKRVSSKPSPNLFVNIIIVSAILLGLPSLYWFFHSQTWSGFGAYTDQNNVYHPAKTLWDWLTLFIVPVILAIIAYFFRKSEIRTSQDLNTDKNRQDALNAYFEFMQKILLESNIKIRSNFDNAGKIATARTLSLLEELDTTRKTHALRFLYESQLLSRERPFINLLRGNLKFVDFSYSSLSEAKLSGCDFENANFARCHLIDTLLSSSSFYKANFEGAYLMRANLEYAILIYADFYRAVLEGASFINATANSANFAKAYMRNAILRDTQLISANLRGADLENAYMLGANLTHANLSNANLRNANLSEVNLMYANLSDADLTGANLTRAIVTKQQLKKATSIKDANLTGIVERLGPPIAIAELEVPESDMKATKIIKPKVEPRHTRNVSQPSKIKIAATNKRKPK